MPNFRQGIYTVRNPGKYVGKAHPDTAVVGK